MSLQDTTAEILDYVRERFAVPPDDPDFGPDVDLFNFGYIDSFGAVDLAVFIQDRFKVKLGAEEWASSSLNTVNSIAAFIAGQNRG